MWLQKKNLVSKYSWLWLMRCDTLCLNHNPCLNAAWESQLFFHNSSLQENYLKVIFQFLEWRPWQGEPDIVKVTYPSMVITVHSITYITVHISLFLIFLILFYTNITQNCLLFSLSCWLSSRWWRKVVHCLMSWDCSFEGKWRGHSSCNTLWTFCRLLFDMFCCWQGSLQWIDMTA